MLRRFNSWFYVCPPYAVAGFLNEIVLCVEAECLRSYADDPPSIPVATQNRREDNVATADTEHVWM